MKVSINLRIRTSDGRQPYCQPVWEGIRIKKLKPGWAIVNGVEEHHPEGVYHLSFYVGGRRKQENVGKHAVLAQRAYERKIASEPDEVVPVAKPTPTRTTLAQLKTKFIVYKRSTAKRDGTPLDEETITAYEQQTTEFLANCQHEYPNADVVIFFDINFDIWTEFRKMRNRKLDQDEAFLASYPTQLLFKEAVRRYCEESGAKLILYTQTISTPQTAAKEIASLLAVEGINLPELPNA